MTLWYRSHGTSVVKEIVNKANRLTIDVGEELTAHRAQRGLLSVWYEELVPILKQKDTGKQVASRLYRTWVGATHNNAATCPHTWADTHACWGLGFASESNHEMSFIPIQALTVSKIQNPSCFHLLLVRILFSRVELTRSQISYSLIINAFLHRDVNGQNVSTGNHWISRPSVCSHRCDPLPDQSVSVAPPWLLTVSVLWACDSARGYLALDRHFHLTCPALVR